MKNILKFANTSQKSSARVVDGKLILSFPHAKRPVVWQMDLTEVKASALEVLEEKDVFSLSVKTPKGERIEIAPFDSKEEAVDGLMAASRALENGQGHIRAAAAPSTAPQTNADQASYSVQRKGSMGKWIIAGIGVFFILYLYNVLISMAPPLPQQSGVSSNSAQNIDPRGAPGVPMSADDFLNNQ